METMINLNDLLKHEIQDLYSVEEQIIEAMPGMIDKAKNPELKKALREHLKITEEQKSRLDKIKQTFGEGDENGGSGENKGFFSRLFGGGGGEKCKGMAGIISEGEKIMNADITDEALDAAIIASAQKIEHYEICGYGTARAFARELQLQEVERLLSQTLNEEYQADDLLTALAVGKLNMEAEQADGLDGRGKAGRANRTGGGSKGGSKSSGGSSSKGGSSKGSKSSGGGRGGSSKGGSSKSGSKSGGGSSKGGSKSSSKGGSSKGGNKSSGGRGGSSKGGSSKGGSKGSSKGGSSRGGSKSGGGKGGSKGSSKGGSRSGRGR